MLAASRNARIRLLLDVTIVNPCISFEGGFLLFFSRHFQSARNTLSTGRKGHLRASNSSVCKERPNTSARALYRRVNQVRGTGVNGDGNGSGGENEGGNGDGDGDEARMGTGAETRKRTQGGNGDGSGNEVRSGDENGNENEEGRGGGRELWNLPRLDRSKVEDSALPFCM